MDRRRRRTRRLALGLALAAGAALAQSAEAPLRASRWIAPEADAVRALSLTPTECLTRPADPEVALAVEVGRAAFRTPVLLGGQAARAGLSCEACHTAGRGNPDFHFPGVSGARGTADVTSSLFSRLRGDGRDDPRPIPDLSGPKERLKIRQEPAASALKPFIRGLVVEEFDGPEPPAVVLDGLAAYVAALSPDACPDEATTRRAAGTLLEDAERAVRAGEALLARGDAASAALMIAAARTALGRVDERYGAKDLAPSRAALRAADDALAQAAVRARAGDPKAAALLAAWRAGLPALRARLARQEPASLFNSEHLEKALRHRLPS